MYLTSVNKIYLPVKDADLQAWATNFLTVTNANLTTLGLIAGDVTPTSTDKTNLDSAITNNVTKQAEAKAAAELKRTDRKKFETSVRILVRKIQANPSVSSQLKAQLGINVRDSNPSPVNPIPPTDLLANPNPNGTNKLSWNRNGNPQGTIFIIEMQDRPGFPWVLIGTTTKTTYDHQGQMPGITKYYRVRAQRNDTTTEPSNEAIVYPGGAPTV